MFNVPQPWFDEIFAEGGTPRPAYAALHRRTSQDPLRPSASSAERLRERPLDDDTRILPIPVVIDDAEYRSIMQVGLMQRARTLQRLFADLVLGRQRVLSAGLGLDRALIGEILAMHDTTLDDLRNLWQAGDRERIRFVYGPDLVRRADGRWVVLEDNVGCVGGTADSFFVADRYQAALGPRAGLDCRPRPDLSAAICRLLRRDERGDDRRGDAISGAVAVLGCEAGADFRGFHLDENARRRQILGWIGVPVVDRQTLTGARPGTVVNFDNDLSWSGVFSQPGVAMLNAPGTGVLGNKALLPYLDDMIRFYTGEAPILPTPDTRLMADGVLPPDPENWVVKTAAGCQGTEVIVLGWQPKDRRIEVARRACAEWAGAAAVLQRYVEPSRLSPAGPGGWDSYRVEIRPIAYVLGWDDVYTGEQPVGKVVSSYDARRLNNVSRGACYAPVLREPCPWCER
jgi:uncharacterized circularly permuted ATP-grasp superfamily protein